MMSPKNPLVVHCPNKIFHLLKECIFNVNLQFHKSSGDAYYSKMYFILCQSYFQNNVSEYGLAHKVAEAYGANPGHGPSIRAAIGTAEDLGISEQQFNRLPTLADYNKKNAGRIKQRPIRKFLQDIGVPLRNV